MPTVSAAYFDALIWLLVGLGLPWALWCLYRELWRAREEEHDAGYPTDS